MKTTLFVSDSLQKGFIEPYFSEGFIFNNHWSIHGYTGPSFLNIILSSTKTNYPTNLKYREKSIAYGRAYPKNAKSVCTHFKDSCFITQHPIFSPQEGYDRLAEQFHYMAFEFKERKVKIQTNRLSQLVETGKAFLEASSDDAMLLLFSIETHTRGCNIYFPNSEDPVSESVKYTAKTIRPLIDASDLFLITSDHGDIWKDGKWQHPMTSTREENPTQFMIPLIILGVGQGNYSGETNTLDLSPTILSLNGKSIPKNYEGRVLEI